MVEEHRDRVGVDMAGESRGLKPWSCPFLWLNGDGNEVEFTVLR